ncbi:MAG: hypothetical protein WCH05_00870 [Chlorobiaceae bacterium]
MRDHTPDFKLHHLSLADKTLIRQTVQQLLEKLAADGKLNGESHLEFWVEVPGLTHPRGTFRGGFLMPDSFVFLGDYFHSDLRALQPASEYSSTGEGLKKAWDDMLDELYYQVEIFTSQHATAKGVTLELWAGNRQRPEGEWVYAVDRKVELGHTL